MSSPRCKVRVQRGQLRGAIHPRDVAVGARVRHDAEPRQLRCGLRVAQPRRSETKSTNESGEYSLGQLLCGLRDAGREAGACVPLAPSSSRLRFPRGMPLRALGVTAPVTTVAAVCAAQAIRKGTRAARRRRRLRGARALRGAQFGEAAAPMRASECERPRGRRRVGSQARPGSGAPTTARGSGRAAARGPETRDAAAASALPVRLRDDQLVFLGGARLLRGRVPHHLVG